MQRKQKALIEKDVQKKMIFLSGPRQVGKTWLAKDIARSFEKSVYLNYDRLEDRKIIQQEAWLDTTEFLILDELHKMPDWKNFLKGVYDTKPDHLKILITGSARLEAFRQSGDSLAGRFYRHRLFPFSPSELKAVSTIGSLEPLLSRGGFPEPFLAEDEREARRWRMQYIDGLIRQDILDFERIHNLKAIQLVFELLRRRVGSPVSYTSIAQDVGISPNTVKKYIQVFEALYIVFRVSPYSKNIARSIVKEPKIYFFDTALVEGDEGVRFENLVALSLLKYVCGMVDYEGEPYALHYLRTKDGREVDFCLVHNDTPKSMIEVKRADDNPSKGLLHFHAKYDLAGVQLVQYLKRERKKQHIDIRDGLTYLRELAY